MDIEIQNNYMDFYLNMSDAYYEVNDNALVIARMNTAEYKVELAKTSYLYLKKAGVEDIGHLRGCLNTLEKELKMEITQ